MRSIKVFNGAANHSTVSDLDRQIQGKVSYEIGNHTNVSKKGGKLGKCNQLDRKPCFSIQLA